MDSYLCRGRVQVYQQRDRPMVASSHEEAAIAYAACYGVLPETVDGVRVLGRCHLCTLPVLDNDRGDQGTSTGPFHPICAGERFGLRQRGGAA